MSASPHSATTEIIDVAIVGGGAAGLSAATTLGRSLRSVIVIDAGRPRNARSAGAHNILGHDGIAPDELLARGRAEAAGYGAQLRSGTVTGVRRDPDDHFVLDIDDDTSVVSRRLLLASGLIDELPDVPGLDDLWGSTVLHCPYCHGYEVRGQRIGVLATGPMSFHQALMFRQLSDDVTLIAHGMPAPSAEEAAQLVGLGIPVVDGPVTRVDDESGTPVAVADDGRRLRFDALVVAPRFRVRDDLYTALGGTLTDHPFGEFIAADPRGQTDIAGVWAAGNAIDLSAMVATSMGAGVLAGAGINADLVVEEARLAASGGKAVEYSA